MRRLSALPQNVVGGVDGVADGAMTEQFKARGNLRWRRPNRSAADFTGGESPAQVGVLNIDGDLGLALRRWKLRGSMG